MPLGVVLTAMFVATGRLISAFPIPTSNETESLIPRVVLFELQRPNGESSVKTCSPLVHRLEGRGGPGRKSIAPTERLGVVPEQAKSLKCRNSSAGRAPHS
jgi:hypothetical protein